MSLSNQSNETITTSQTATTNANLLKNVVFVGKKRYYVQDLTQKDFTLENTTPYKIKLLGKEIEEHSWGALLQACSAYLVELDPTYMAKLLSFKCSWSKQNMYDVTSKTNYRCVKDGLYVNANHTALHSCWFLQELLTFLGIDLSKVEFLIHRPCSAEPKEVRDFIEAQFKSGFTTFICDSFGKDLEHAKKTVLFIEKYLNPLLKDISKSYTNFFLFDDNVILASYSKKVRDQINNSIKFEEKAKKALNKSLDYLVKFYKE